MRGPRTEELLARLGLAHYHPPSAWHMASEGLYSVAGCAGREKRSMQALHRLHRLGFVHQEADVPLRGSLADHTDVDITNRAEGPAGDFRMAPDLLSHQADQRLVVFPANIGHAFQFFGNRRQRRHRTHQQRQAAA